MQLIAFQVFFLKVLLYNGIFILIGGPDPWIPHLVGLKSRILGTHYDKE
jgi:hypothetical protein